MCLRLIGKGYTSGSWTRQIPSKVGFFQLQRLQTHASWGSPNLYNFFTPTRRLQHTRYRLRYPTTTLTDARSMLNLMQAFAPRPVQLSCDFTDYCDLSHKRCEDDVALSVLTISRGMSYASRRIVY